MKKFGLPTCQDVFKHRYHGEKLGAYSKVMLKLHMMICKNCQHFESTMKGVEIKMKSALKQRLAKSSSKDIQELKNRIKKSL